QVSSLASRCKEDVEQWLNRQLEAHYLAFYINAIFVPTRSEGKVSHQAYYTILGIREDGSREVLSLVHHPTEGASCWQSVLEELKERGVLQVDLVISDALTGIETAIRLYFPRPTTSSVSYTSNAAFATPSLPKTSLRFSTNWGRSFRWSSPTSPRPWAMKPFSTSLSGGRRNTSLSNAIDTPET
ncbi:MAG: transposase, partial [Bacteroidaceae bacterium]|nr:transposase [Bacteroidaceae bacterium]MCF0236103.1 transposase [Bacteroidaceae bacterium]